MLASRKSNSRLYFVAGNLILFAFLIRWTHQNITLGTLIDQLSQISIAGVFISLCVYLVVLVLYGKRMAVLLGVQFSTGFNIVNIGYAANVVLPLRLGDAFKVVWAHRIGAVSMTGLVASSLVEKVLDAVKLSVLALIASLWATNKFYQSGLETPVLLLVAVLSCVLICAPLCYAYGTSLLRRVSRLRRIYVELRKHVRRYPKNEILFLTFCIAIANVALVHLSFNIYLPNLEIKLMDSILLFLLLALSVAVPSAPANIGLFETAIVAYLTKAVGVENEAALTAAIVFHTVLAVPPIIFSMLVALRNRRSL